MGRAAWRRRKAALLLAVAFVACGVGVLAYATNLLRRSEEQTIDARFSMRGPQRAPANIVIVAIDNASLQELNEKKYASEFPFPRKYDAQVIDRLRKGGARAIAVDLQFTQQTNETEDNELIEAVGRAHGRIVLTTTSVGRNGETQILGGNKLLPKSAPGRRARRLTVDSDGSVRRFPFEYTACKSFGVVTPGSGERQGRSTPRCSKTGTLPIDFVGPPESFRSISYSKVLTGQYPPSTFLGKTVILGATAPVLQDVHTTATTNGAVMSGPEIWANVVSTLQRGCRCAASSAGSTSLLIVLLGALAPLGERAARAAARDARGVRRGHAPAPSARRSRSTTGVIVELRVSAARARPIASLGTLAVVYLSETIERERVHDLFARFVPPDVVAQVVARTDDNLRLGAVERDCTVLFSDLRGFTSFSETQPASRVIDVVNCYLNEMTEAIQDAGGTLISYMGDGIMAVFGAPLEQPDHADRALTAATEMIGPRLAAIQRLARRAGSRAPLPHGRGAQQRPGHGGQHRLRATRRVHGARRHHEHRLAP